MTKSNDIDTRLVNFMEGLGYKPVTTVKDHRVVTRFEHPDPSLQNVSQALAQRIETTVAEAEKAARIEELDMLIAASGSMGFVRYWSLVNRKKDLETGQPQLTRNKEKGYN